MTGEAVFHRRLSGSSASSVPDDSPIARLAQGAIELGESLSPSKITQFSSYLTELQKWNRRMNLSGSKDHSEIVTRHFLDSLAGLSVLRDITDEEEVADLGAGAGFPGVPIKIARPSLRLTLVEPRQKRAAFLLHLCGTLGLTDIQVVEEAITANHCPPRYRQRFSRVLMRAVAEPSQSAEMARPLLCPSGKVIIWSSDRQAARFQGSVERIHYAIPGTQLTSSLLVFSAQAR